MAKYVMLGTDMRRKDVKKHGGCGAVYLPKKWIGRDVVVVLLRKKKGGLLNAQKKEGQ